MQPADVEVAVAEGVRLHVRSWPGSRTPPFLLVHGLSSNARLWDEVAGHLSATGHPSYAVDLRSHGESDAPEQGYDTATAARDLAMLAGGLELAPAVVVGQSWGGNVVARFAATHPEAVAAVALVDGGWIDLSTDFDSWEACAAALRPPEIDGQRADELRQWMRSSHGDWSPTAIEATLANLRTEPDGRLSRRLSIPRHMQIVRSMWDDPPWPDLAKISAPTLLLPAVPAGEQGSHRRRAQVAKAAAALSQATVREYVGADHDLHAQHPQRLAEDLLTLADGGAG
ncbi:MAG: alpha/beta fold hydrolase [Micromonosporaceae bacterium]